MATENAIKIVGSLQIENGSFIFPRIGNQQQLIDQNNKGGGYPGEVEITETPEVIPFGDVVTPGWAYIKNVSDGAYINLGPQVGGSGGAMQPFLRLKPGEGHPFRLYPTTVLMAGIDATEGSGSGSGDSAAKLQIFIFED